MSLEHFKGRTGRPIKDQIIVRTPDYTLFKSYGRPIVLTTFINKRVVILDETYWDYSRTTGKYRNQFLGEGIQETRKKIKSGEYLVTDLEEMLKCL